MKMPEILIVIIIILLGTYGVRSIYKEKPVPVTAVTATVVASKPVMIYDNFSPDGPFNFKRLVSPGTILGIRGESGDYYDIQASSYDTDYIAKKYVKLNVEFLK